MRRINDIEPATSVNPEGNTLSRFRRPAGTFSLLARTAALTILATIATPTVAVAAPGGKARTELVLPEGSHIDSLAISIDGRVSDDGLNTTTSARVDSKSDDGKRTSRINARDEGTVDLTGSVDERTIRILQGKKVTALIRGERTPTGTIQGKVTMTLPIVRFDADFIEDVTSHAEFKLSDILASGHIPRHLLLQRLLKDGAGSMEVSITMDNGGNGVLTGTADVEIGFEIRGTDLESLLTTAAQTKPSVKGKAKCDACPVPPKVRHEPMPQVGDPTLRVDNCSITLSEDVGAKPEFHLLNGKPPFLQSARSVRFMLPDQPAPNGLYQVTMIATRPDGRTEIYKTETGLRPDEKSPYICDFVRQ